MCPTKRDVCDPAAALGFGRLQLSKVCGVYFFPGKYYFVIIPDAPMQEQMT